ncbi:conjugative transposon TraJ protein [Sunxiuqinia elliptica]|jgi:conjugative transposon TraJ protein|uniref:Conjugative transposon TraJ protein n=1 Tax=Sunxiuqinia elliptica TaxID=655355 RepID=A0A4R6HA15_9BACT|nr:conjugative transposon TraJ protein [Sunxiuqinia elliptica]TDO64375.1 conjugative transposon TraJ protein [Sunxiuqinia elliptica]
MTLLAINFDNLHQILSNLYQQMLPLCSDMIGVAKGVAGLGALFYVAYRVWKSLASAEPIDVFPLLRPFAIGLCIMFFPTIVLGTINAVMSPVVQGAHGILESQIENVDALQQQRDDLEYQARVREGKAWVVDDEVYEQKMSELGIRQLGTKLSMWWEHAMYQLKSWWRELVTDFFELLYNAAGLTIDTLRTFFLVVLAILGPLSFALSIYDGFHSTLTNWIARYISVYLWLPVADIFSAVLSKIRALMLESDIALLQDPSYIPDGTNGVYIVFLIIGIIGYFSIPTVAEWIIQSGGGASGAMSGISKAGAFGAGVAGGIAGNAVGKVFKRKGGGKKDSGGGGGDDGGGSGSPDGQNLATQDDSGGGGSGGYGDQE